MHIISPSEAIILCAHAPPIILVVVVVVVILMNGQLDEEM